MRDQCREDQTDDKQCQWHPERDKGKRAKVGHCNKLHVSWSSCFIWWLQTRGLSRIAQATATLTKLKPIWRDDNISLGSKVKLMRSLVISIFLYAYESWTLTAELEKRTQAFEMRCYRRLLNISYRTMLPMRRFAERSKQPLENMTNSWFWSRNES